MSPGFDAALAAIRAVLAGPMASAHLPRFGPEARLNEDLHLDSVLVLNLILHLEVAHGFEIPDRALSGDDLSTVGDLARLLSGAPAAPPGGPAPDELDIKVHCVVSCLSAGIKAQGLDQRPFYFGVWDAGFAVLPDARLTYHAPSVTHAHFLHWFERLYGVPVHEWYDPGQDKAANIRAFERLLAAKSPTEHLMVMLDLYHLPERENKFNQNPFPHYVMIEPTDDPEVWFMHDPDYRWQGPLPRAAVLNAIAQPSVAGGYLYDRALARPPSDAAVRDYFRAMFRPDANPLTAAVRDIVAEHAGPRATQPTAALDLALRELPVIAIRKYAYEHGFAFFWRALGTSDAEFDARCDEIEVLHQGFRALHYDIVKLAQTGDPALTPTILAALDALDRREFRIKAALAAAFEEWLDRCTAPRDAMPA